MSTSREGPNNAMVADHYKKLGFSPVQTLDGSTSALASDGFVPLRLETLVNDRILAKEMASA